MKLEKSRENQKVKKNENVFLYLGFWVRLRDSSVVVERLTSLKGWVDGT